MTHLKERIDGLVLPQSITQKYNRLGLKWIQSLAGFEIFDFLNQGQSKVNIGDDADYLQLFSTIADRLYDLPQIESEPVVAACDAKGSRLFVRIFSLAEKERYRYAYVALGAASKNLPETEINETFSFFARISRERSTGEGFEKEARKVARGLKEASLDAWNRIIEEKLDFIKTDLYAFHLLKLFSWGFKIVEKNGQLSAEQNLVRPKPGKPRGASRH